MQIGGSPALAVPVPLGVPFIARVHWTGPDRCAVKDGHGGDHTLVPGHDLNIAMGEVSLRLSLVEQFSLRRTNRVSAIMSFSWLTLAVLTSLIAAQGAFVQRNYCNIVVRLLGRSDPQCMANQDDNDGGYAGGYWTAEYLARLLREDLDGEQQGVVESDIDRPDAERSLDEKRVFLPSGSQGPITEMGGARNLAPRPVRGADEELVVPQQRKQEQHPLHAEDSPVVVPKATQSQAAKEGEDQGLDVSGEQESPESAAEEAEGWGDSRLVR